MESNNLTYYIRNILYPLTFGYIDRIFQRMDFVRTSYGWASPKNIDGNDPQHPRKDKTVIRESIPYRAFENGGGGSRDLIDLYKDLNGCKTFEAVKDIADIVGATLPAMEPEQKEQWREYRQQQNQREDSLKRQVAALYSPVGKATLDYLHSRGWRDDEIKGAELGHITKDEAEAMGLQWEIGTDYTLSIPLRSSGFLYGFKFRTISKEVEDRKNKYRFTKGQEKELFGLTGVKKEDGSVIVVEGELDALRAKVNGITNVVATQGGGLTDKLAQAAKDRGIKEAILLLDNDKAGEGFITRSITAAHKYSLHCSVAILTESKDVDTYLGSHAAEELRQIIANAQLASTYQLNRLIEDFQEKRAKGGEDITTRELILLQDEVIKLANNTPNETERRLVLTQYIGSIDGANITEEDILAVADRERRRADAEQQKLGTEKAAKDIAALVDRGETKAALELMRTASQSLNDINRSEKYSHLLVPQKESDIRSRMRKKQNELETDYIFSNSKGDQEPLYLTAGAITFICGPTNHGKSTFLKNIALKVARSEEPGDTLYFTFEEDGDSVLLQMLNTYIDKNLCVNNLRAIKSLWSTGREYFNKDQVDNYYKGERLFFSELIESGKLRLFYEDYDSTELIEAIEAYCRKRKVKAVFVDYIQHISKNGCKKQRNEELKEICKDLSDLAIKTQLPIIVAAQLNRKAKNPLELHSQYIADSADIERIANKIVCVWNSAFKPYESADAKKDLEDLETRKGIKLGVGGKIYAIIQKNRGGLVGIDAAFDFTGNTGAIKGNVPTKGEETQTADKKPFYMGKRPKEEQLPPTREQEAPF